MFDHPPPTKATAHAASGLNAYILDGLCVPPSSIDTDCEGGLIYDWLCGKRRLLIIIDGALIHAVNFATTPQAVYYDDIPFAGDNLPTEIATLIPRRDV